MKKILLTLATATISGLLLTSPAVAANKTVNVKFAKNTSSATYNGKITGYDYTDYVFTAREGQSLYPKTTGRVETYLMGDGLDDSISLGEYSPNLNQKGAYVLPYSGTYKVRIGQAKAGSMAGRTANYTFKMTIK